MPIPEYVAGLRSMVGHHLLWLPGVTAVVLRDEEMLLVQRADDGSWTPITGIVDPLEAPADTAVREAREETGVEIAVERLTGVYVVPEVTYPNGDRSAYVDTTFVCRWVSGEPYPADDESTDARWWPVSRLPAMTAAMTERVSDALAGREAARF